MVIDGNGRSQTEQVEERPKSEVDGIRISRRQVMMGQWAFLGISCGKKKKIDPLFGLNANHVWTGGERINCGSLGWRVRLFSEAGHQASC